jgi:hypothetical protein
MNNTGFSAKSLNESADLGQIYITRLDQMIHLILTVLQVACCPPAFVIWCNKLGLRVSCTICEEKQA